MQLFTGLDYLRIAVANHFGLDKKEWDTRLGFVKGKSMCDLLELSHDAEEPILMRKAMRNLQLAYEGKPVTMPVALDATASGVQILSCLAGCTKSGDMVNLVDPNHRRDLYLQAAESTGGILTRDELKPATMTTFYGSKAQPKIILGEDTAELEAFYNMLSTQLPGAYSLLEDIQSCWQPNALAHSWEMFDGHQVHIPVMQPLDTKIEIDTLGGMSFTHRHMINEGMDVGISLAANITHACDGYVVREMQRRARYNLSRIEFLRDLFSKIMGTPDIDEPCPMNIERVISTDRIYSLTHKEAYREFTEGELHHMNHRIHSMAVHQPYYLLPIHDSFAQHPNFCNRTRINYANILTEIACTDSLQYLLRQVTGDYDLTYVKDDGELWKYIQKSNYPLS